MAQPAAASDNKKRKLTSIINHKETPILFLNVGGAKRNIRRSVWNALRDASCGGKTPSLGQGDVEAREELEVDSNANQNQQGNPLCDLVLKGAAHWSDVPTTSDDDGTIRIYLDRNPQALDDLLEYIEYGKVFLKGLISKDDNGARLERLQMECDFFTVNTLMKDVDDVMFGEAVSFRSDGWFSIAGDCLRDEDGDAVNWNWRKVCGNESIATRGGSGGSISICDVKTTGTYLMFFSLHSVAVTALSPGQFYTKDFADEFVQVSMFHEVMTKSEDSHWAYPLVRCGAFDYRDNKETRENEPLLFTAAFAEPVSLKKGNELYCSHGHGIVQPGFIPVNDQVVENSFFSLEEPHCLNFITLVRVFGDSIARWSVKCERDPNSEHSIIKWLPAQDDFPKTSQEQGAHLDENDETKIRFRKEGYYLLLGRVAARLKKKFNTDDAYYGTVRLELRTNGGLPLHIDPELVSYPNNFNEDLYFNKKMAEYGPINDIIYAESDSYISVRATAGACFARHGTAPSPSFGVDKIPTQSLSAIRLDYNMRVDRYQVSRYQNKVSYKRALGGEESVPNQAPLFVAANRNEPGLLKALEDCRCIVIGCLSCKMGDTVSLYKNNDAIIHSQLCDGSGHGYGSHTLNTVVEIKANDTFVIKSRGSDVQSGGHLAFLTLQ